MKWGLFVIHGGLIIVFTVVAAALFAEPWVFAEVAFHTFGVMIIIIFIDQNWIGYTGATFMYFITWALILILVNIVAGFNNDKHKLSKYF
jgi:hypothetical protein